MIFHSERVLGGSVLPLLIALDGKRAAMNSQLVVYSEV